MGGGLGGGVMDTWISEPGKSNLDAMREEHNDG